MTTTRPADLLVVGADVVTMDAQRQVVTDATLALSDGVIAAIGPADRLRAQYPGATELDATSCLVIPGMLKLKVVRRPATKAKQGVNPFTKEPMTIKAKPARNVIKALPLKALKDSV